MNRLFTCFVAIILIIGFTASKANTIVVCSNGNGDYKTLQEAINAQRAFSPNDIVIHLKPGVYREKVVVATWMTGISLIGENAETTIVSWDDFSGKSADMHTFNSYSFLVAGNDFYAENITFENNAGRVGQAVAMHVEADRAVFVNCRFLGDQDTVYLGREGSRQLFYNCYIEGTTDFIFGPSTAVFQNCHIVSKSNSYITAASTPANIEYGYVFINCRLTANEGVDKVYLGRPWRNYAKTVFINCNMDNHINAQGWHNWNRPEAEKTVFYAEYASSGKGGSVKDRVKWAKVLTVNEAEKYTLANVLGGDWFYKYITK